MESKCETGRSSTSEKLNKPSTHEDDHPFIFGQNSSGPRSPSSISTVHSNATNENDHLQQDYPVRSRKSLSPSSSYASSSDHNGDHIQLGGPTTTTPQTNEEDMLDFVQEEEEFPASSMPKNGQSSSSSDDMAIQLPPNQTMDRNQINPSSSSFRIPDYVFARTKSTAPLEWSVASNESLFSIHEGNVSFTREQINWLRKSGDLGTLYEQDIMSSPYIELSHTTQCMVSKPADVGLESGVGLDSDSDLEVVTEATASETMREVIRENSGNRKGNFEKQEQFLESQYHDHHQEHVSPLDSMHHLAQLSHRSDESMKSFAFPILTGDGEKTMSRKISGAEKKRQKSGRGSLPEAVPSKKQEPGEATSSKETTMTLDFRKWFSCFSCCPFCSKV